MAFGVIRELVTRLGFTIDDAEARRYERRLKNLGRTIRGVGRSLSLFVTAPIVALGGSFIKAAADAEETDSKFKEVFKSIAEEADATAKALAKDFDLANVSAQEMLSSTGDILIGFGFTEKAALDLSRQVNSLAVDIASFKNVQGGAAQASNAITKALLGEREMLKGIGIAILEEDVKLKIAQLTTEGMTFATNRQAKSFATLQLVIDRSAKAIGDYNRTQGSATNQARKLRQQFIELSVTFGKVLLPVFTDLVKVLGSVLEWFNSFSPAARKAIVIIAGIVAALGPLLFVLGSIVALLLAIPTLAIAAVVAVGALGFLIGEDIAAMLQGRKSVFGLILAAVVRAFGFLLDKAKETITSVITFLTEVWTKWIATHIQPWLDRIERAAKFAGLGGGPQSRTSAALGLLTLGPALQGARAVGNVFQPADQSNVTINLDQTINAAPGMSEGVIARESATEVQRLFDEALSLGAGAPRMAP